MKLSDFADSAGYIRVLEKRLLTGETVTKLADTTSLEEATRIVSQNTDYDFSNLKYLEDFESILKDELVRVYKIGFEICKNKDVIKILSIKYDFNNLKMAIKSNLLNLKNVEYSYVTDVNPDDFQNLFKENEDISMIPDYLTKAYSKSLEEYEISKNPQTISIVLDKEMFEEMLSLANKTESELIIDYVKTLIDIYNLKTLIRCMSLKKESSFLNNALIEGGKIDKKEIQDYFSKSTDYLSNKLFYKYMGNEIKTGIDNYESTHSLALFEKLLDNYLITLLKKAKYIPYGPELVFSYIANKENEIRQIRIVLTGKMNEIPPEKLKERLRENYA